MFILAILSLQPFPVKDIIAIIVMTTETHSQRLLLIYRGKDVLNIMT
jgi:hypothetical protein